MNAKLASLCEKIRNDIADSKLPDGCEAVFQWVSYNPLLETSEFRRSMFAWLRKIDDGTELRVQPGTENALFGNPNGLHVRVAAGITKPSKSYGAKRIETKEFN